MRASISLWKMKHAALNYQEEKNRERRKEALLKLKFLVHEEKIRNIK